MFCAFGKWNDFRWWLIILQYIFTSNCIVIVFIISFIYFILFGLCLYELGIVGVWGSNYASNFEHLVQQIACMRYFTIHIISLQKLVGMQWSNIILCDRPKWSAYIYGEWYIYMYIYNSMQLIVMELDKNSSGWAHKFFRINKQYLLTTSINPHLNPPPCATMESIFYFSRVS